jgi:hypothetical protein
LVRRTKIGDAAFCLPPREYTKAVMLDFVGSSQGTKAADEMREEHRRRVLGE